MPRRTAHTRKTFFDPFMLLFPIHANPCCCSRFRSHPSCVTFRSLASLLHRRHPPLPNYLTPPCFYPLRVTPCSIPCQSHLPLLHNSLIFFQYTGYYGALHIWCSLVLYFTITLYPNTHIILMHDSARSYKTKRNEGTGYLSTTLHSDAPTCTAESRSQGSM